MARIRSAASTNTSSASVTPYPAAFATCRKWRRTINGGNWSDTLFGGTGDDKIIGGSGNDAPYGGHNSDTLSGWGGKIASTVAKVMISYTEIKATTLLMVVMGMTGFQVGMEMIV
jgi:Ca2+-binding RTX toxin-like protein